MPLRPRPGQHHLAVAAYVTLGLVWGFSFLFMDLALAVVTPGQTALLRVVFGVLPIAVLAAGSGHLRLAHWHHAHHFVVQATLAAGLYYVAYAAGTARLDSGLAGAVSGTIPLFAILGAAALLRDEALSAPRLAGLGVGAAGVALIAAPWEAGTVDVVGLGWMLLGSASLGLSFAYARRFVTPLGIHPMASATYQMLIAAIGLSLLTDLRGITAIAQRPSSLVAAVLGLGLLCTGVAFVLYYVVVTGLGAATAATSTYVPPVVAMVVGVVALGETFRPLALLGVALIVLGALVGRPRSARANPPGDDVREVAAVA